MDVREEQRTSESLTPEAFELLLSRLAPDRNVAGHEYERLRLNLANYFRLKGLSEPFAVADATLDRVARLLTSNNVVNLASFCFGVARLVCLEQFRAEQRQSIANEDFATGVKPEVEEDFYELLRSCLMEIEPEGQKLLRAYFADLAPQERYVSRQNLAKKAGISMDRLRLRVHRLRRKLENCLAQHHKQ